MLNYFGADITSEGTTASIKPEKVAVNFGKEDEKWLDEMSVEEAQKYVEEGQFAPGSMLPKVQAAMDFAASGEGRTAMITLLEKAKDGIQGKTGTKIHI